MKKIVTVLLVLILGTLLVYAAEKTLKLQTTCPVAGEKINKKSFIDYQGQRVYFCCEDCKKNFNKDPEKYLKKFEENGILLENVQKIDPVCGMELKEKKIYKDYKGRRVFFCSEYCSMEFEKEPQKYLVNMGS